MKFAWSSMIDASLSYTDETYGTEFRKTIENNTNASVGSDRLVTRSNGEPVGRRKLRRVRKRFEKKVAERR